ncbi:MAG: hypothetical protein V4819_10660 [Verrucomicrobiota bacterium]
MKLKPSNLLLLAAATIVVTSSASAKPAATRIRPTDNRPAVFLFWNEAC